MKIALVADSMSCYGGAERVIEQILHAYPNADVFALLDTVPADQRDFLGGRPVRTSFLQRLPRVRDLYRKFFALWPLAIEQFDLAAYDLVISSHHSVAQGVITHPDQVHVAYVHSPMRYAWDLQPEYLRQAGLERGIPGWLARSILHYARRWDYVAAQRPDAIAVNSGFVQRRVQKFYGRSSRVIHPPVETGRFHRPRGAGGYYLSVCRLVPYKRVNLLLDAFALLPDKRLKIVGTGPELKRLRKIAPPNVEILGWLDADAVVGLMAGADAFLYGGVEDFGISLVEAQAAGTPVIAFGRGGATETVRRFGWMDAPTGILFEEQSGTSLAEAIRTFEANRDAFSAEACRSQAERFEVARFRVAFRDFVEEALRNFRPGGPSATVRQPSRPVVPANDLVQVGLSFAGRSAESGAKNA